MRLWGIRHLRYFWLQVRLQWLWMHYKGPGIFINQADIEYLDAVWRGER